MSKQSRRCSKKGQASIAILQSATATALFGNALAFNQAKAKIVKKKRRRVNGSN